ncbi:hypothetical protein OQ968_21935 [Mycobacterium sp. 663a-19]|uniref:hypothetical protein n=1 Tax=Mycobacterium sp. 663a-19 TaxID=2986148 RepID=UPI002D1E5656|nr:hypothetical protein [Mycobacterium sp. 663a-19]MEB3983914.1 hypothetical protein [Mycobacterium sp. 663a-19]
MVKAITLAHDCTKSVGQWNFGPGPDSVLEVGKVATSEHTDVMASTLSYASADRYEESIDRTDLGMKIRMIRAVSAGGGDMQGL